MRPKALKLVATTAVGLCLFGAGIAIAAPAGFPPIVITEDAIMDFGSIVAPVGASANFVLDTTDTVTTCPTTCLGTPLSATFTATGKKNKTVAITFSAGDTLTGPGPAMALGTFTHDAGATPTFDALDTLTFNVGATLTVGASQIDGTYSGTYTITVEYN